jgi:gluconate 2-dehydrogenase gamma chain
LFFRDKNLIPKWMTTEIMGAKKMRLIRRDFFRSLFVSFGSLGVLGKTGRIYALAHAQENKGNVAHGCRFFNGNQARTLEAICEQIIPLDDNPGAKDAGVLYFIDNALATWAPEHRWDYVAGLEGIDESSQLMFGSNFLNLKWDQQTRVLEAMEQGLVPGEIWKRLKIGSRPSGNGDGGRSDQQFLDLVIDHSMQGYYGDPKYGGNRNHVSWKMIGYSGHRG